MGSGKQWLWTGAMGTALAFAATQVQPVLAGGCCGGGGDKGGHGDHGAPSDDSRTAKPDPLKGGAAEDNAIQKQREAYPVTVCPVSGDALGGEMGEPFDIVHEGRLVRLCCKGCVKDFNKDLQKYLDKLDQRIVEKLKPTYPLDTCVVSGEKLGGEMGEPVDYVYQNRLVRFCCKGCIKKFQKDPEKYLAKIGKPAEKEGEKPSTPSRKEGHGGHGGHH